MPKNVEKIGECGGAPAHDFLCMSCPLWPHVEQEGFHSIVHTAMRNNDWDNSSLDPEDTQETYEVVASTPYDGYLVEADDAAHTGTETHRFAQAIIECYKRQ